MVGHVTTVGGRRECGEGGGVPLRWHTALVRHRFGGGALVLVSVAALAACTIPPVTTEVRPDGTEVTLEWAGYPGHAYVEADDILAAPDIDQIEEHGRAFLDAVQSEVAAKVGIRMRLLSGEGMWNPFATNGYGSPSLLTSYACCSLVADVVPDEYEDWMRVYDIVARLSAEYGAGPMIREQDQEEVRDDPEQLAQFEETWATGVEGEHSLLSAWTTDSGQSVMLTIEDPARRLAASAEEKKKNEPRMSVDYSATVIQRGKRAEFEERLAPFVGAEKPDSTEWD